MRHPLKLALFICSVVTAASGAAAQPSRAAPTTSASFYATKIEVRDMAATLRFYMDFLGMQKVPNDTSGHDHVVLLRADDGKSHDPAEGPLLILNSAKAAPQLGSAYGPVVFVVPDVDKIISNMKAAGVKILEESKHSGAFAVAYVEDPDGRPVELLQVGQGQTQLHHEK